MRRRLPPITHLQYLVLGILQAGERPGRVIRDVVAGYGVRQSGPAFYQMMARLEREGLIDGRYEQISAGDQMVKERRYKLRPAGSKLWAETRGFYETVDLAARQRWSDA
jgi:DNA-binding PadR family transcriptional regulator